MIERLLHRLFKCEEINGGGVCPTYLYRWTLIQPRWPRSLWRGFGIYLHKFVGEDWSRDLHDHPKRFISIGLRGAYVETTMVPCRVMDSYHGEWKSGEQEFKRVYRAPWLRTFPATHRHRIQIIDGRPCWTLVVVLRTSREWGFWHDGRFVPWRVFVNGPLASQTKACSD